MSLPNYSYNTTKICKLLRSQSTFLLLFIYFLFVLGYNEDAKPISVTGEGLLARILQHEVDHLAGRLFIDIMDPQTFQNDGWQAINRARGNMHIFFTPEKL